MTKKKTTLQADIKESAHQVWLAGLGALAVAEEEGSRLFKNLVKKGEAFEKRGMKQFKKVTETVEDQVGSARDQAETAWGKLGRNFDEKVADTLQRLGVPSRMEIQKLTKRVEQLTKKVDAAKPRTTRSRATQTKKTA